jgi:hypothetical protein
LCDIAPTLQPREVVACNGSDMTVFYPRKKGDRVVDPQPCVGSEPDALLRFDIPYFRTVESTRSPHSMSSKISLARFDVGNARVYVMH